MARLLLGFLLIVSMNRADVERAVAFARWPHTDAERARFHARYITRYQRPHPLDFNYSESIEIFTEFRRMELITERHEQLNDLFARGGAINEAEDALKPYRGRVSIVAHVLNGLLTVTTPEIGVALTGENAPRPIGGSTTPVYAGDTIVGGDYDAEFASASIGQGTYVVSVRWNGAELARTTVDFRVLE
jgi:hypothetical protein